MRHIKYESEARSLIMAGINKAVDLVKKTLGPRGKSILIKRSFMTQQGIQFSPAYATKDGISVLREIELPDGIENMGVDLCKNASEKTMQETGDSTTSTLVLLQSLCESGLKAIDAGGNPYEVKAGMDAAVAEVVGYLEEMAVSVDDDVDAIKKVATISANNDESIGSLISEAFAKIGKEGVIDLEVSNSEKTTIKVVPGVKFDKGYASPYFITNFAKGEAELVNPYVLLYDKKIVLMKSLIPVLTKVMQESRSLLIICDDVDGEALAGLTMNVSKGTMKVCVVLSPEFGDLKREAMEDLAKITGAKYLSDEKGTSLDKKGVESLGEVTKAIITKGETVLVIGEEMSNGRREGHISELRLNLAQIEDPRLRERMEKRIARIAGGVAVLSVGAATEIEMREKLDRCDDAIKATKAAIAEGYVPGGGTAFVRCAQRLAPISEAAKSFKAGRNNVITALRTPLSQIIQNAEKDAGYFEAVVGGTGNYGYDAKADSFGDMIESGIIDPKKSLRTALENAASVAGVLITTGGINCDTFN